MSKTTTTQRQIQADHARAHGHETLWTYRLTDGEPFEAIAATEARAFSVLMAERPGQVAVLLRSTPPTIRSGDHDTRRMQLRLAAVAARDALLSEFPNVACRQALLLLQAALDAEDAHDSSEMAAEDAEIERLHTESQTPAQVEHYAAVGTDGTRLVVWGLGATEDEAMRDARWQEDVPKLRCGALALETHQITDEQARHVLAGTISWDAVRRMAATTESHTPKTDEAQRRAEAYDAFAKRGFDRLWQEAAESVTEIEMQAEKLRKCSENQWDEHQIGEMCPGPSHALLDMEDAALEQIQATARAVAHDLREALEEPTDVTPVEPAATVRTDGSELIVGGDWKSAHLVVK